MLEEALPLDDALPLFDEPSHAANVASKYVTAMVLTTFISSHLCRGKVRRQCSESIPEPVGMRDECLLDCYQSLSANDGEPH